MTGDSAGFEHWHPSILLHHELGWLPRLEGLLVCYHVETCPVCTLSCTVLRYAADLVGLELVTAAAHRRADVAGEPPVSN